MEVKKLAANR